MISTVVYEAIKRHTGKVSPSLRDYKRMTEEILKIISVQLTKQNDSKVSETAEETTDDGAAEQIDNANS
jgi:hypothetical protein